DVSGRVRKMTLDAYTHQNLPFEKLVEELQPDRGLNRNPLYQVLFALQNVPQEQVSLPGLTSHLLTVKDETMMFDLDLSMWEQADELIGGLKYNTALFDATTIDRMCSDFLTLLEGIVADPTQRIADLSLLSPAQQQQLLVGWNATQQDYSQHR